jgi:hypothetical protein
MRTVLYTSASHATGIVRQANAYIAVVKLNLKEQLVLLMHQDMRL